ncbi:hypothetical protein [Polymorphobacter fuscus]|uniref:Uncharacterized protein n=1 Tax=Sandarakinorhabdus fusca TaxID=1439888 RepID=A0A7C9KG70_9SPHN|nr:hypothetical protein [Polymorphobacter fuscus]KAB7648347.1 hypothetical protein F9290_01090 [Polymorphobacter fuscus]MQT15860.1 hypothetical protein [Polymorphobacter fuscus]NJC07867.1 hypothetical protein [Polymorphobacter fuscus]
MVDQPAYDADFAAGDPAFADELSGDIYPAPRSAPRRPAGNGGNGLATLVQRQLFGLAGNSKEQLVGNVAGIVAIVREIAKQVEGLGFEPLTAYARQAADLVDDLHHNIAEKDVEALVDDGRELVREHPEVAVVSAVILGFIGARLLKART